MPFIASAAALSVWGFVAHEAGAGWLQAVGALVAGALVVGMLAPAVFVARARCRVVAAPHDASAGFPVALEIRTDAPVLLQPVDPPGPSTTAGHRGTVLLEVRPEHRGVVERCTVTIASAAPFGIVWWARTAVVTLPHPLAVAPRVGVQGRESRQGRDPADSALEAPGHGGDPRGVRPYERGDRRSLVHWPATAHAGTIMVRESEQPGQRASIVDGRLPADPSRAERHAERVMAEVHALLRAGVHVELETEEPGGDVVAPVTSLRAAGRRLALALPRARATTPGGHGQAQAEARAPAEARARRVRRTTRHP